MIIGVVIYLLLGCVIAGLALGGQAEEALRDHPIRVLVTILLWPFLVVFGLASTFN